MSRPRGRKEDAIEVPTSSPPAQTQQTEPVEKTTMSEKHMPTDESAITSPTPLDPDLLRQAINDCRIPSDVTMALFGHLSEIASEYNRLALAAATAGAELRDVLAKGVDDETP